MYICTVMCCAVGTTDQAADLEQYDVCSQASVRHNHSETLDMIASDISRRPLKRNYPPGSTQASNATWWRTGPRTRG